MSDCVFCKIVAGQIPSSKVYESDRTLAILDINPIAFGHTLVLPKEHREILTDLSSEQAGELFAAVHRVAPAVVKGAGAEGFNVVFNNKKCSGQAIPHVHAHIIPRKTDDGVRFNWSPKKYPDGESDRMLAQIKSALG